WPGIAVRKTASLPLAYSRASTSFLTRGFKDVDARHKAGHDELKSERQPNRVTEGVRRSRTPVHQRILDTTAAARQHIDKTTSQTRQPVEEAPGVDGPLSGIRVVELGTLIAAPFAARLFAEFGAEVIKIEQPGSGDPLRKWRKLHQGTSLWWYLQSRNKKSIA